MSSYVLSINGRKHRVTIQSDGTKTYDPPLEASDNIDRMQDVLESRQFPGARTENSWFAGRGTLADQFPSEQEWLNGVCKKVKERGGDVTPHSIYLQSLVRPGFEDGDPEAMVTQADGVTKIQKVMESRGIRHMDGVIKSSGSAFDDIDDMANCKPLADDVIERFAADYKSQDPDTFGRMSDGELREMIIDRHAPKDGFSSVG